MIPIPTNIPWKLIGGAVGILAAVAALWWLVSSRDSWRDQAKAEAAAHQTTITNYRAAAAKAQADDAANKARVEAEQRTINERTAHEYQARIADVRARYERLQPRAGTVASGPVSPSVPHVSPGTSGPTPAAPQGGLSTDDALVATEQAIQLDELIRWVKSQSAIKPDTQEKK